jgi:hypothetical protein
MLTNEPLSHHIGHDGFVWFVGIVKDVADTLKVGRVKVRIIGWHDSDLSIDQLPWAYPLQPVTQPIATPALRVSDWVVGFFLDGKLGQQPIVFGVLPSIPQGGLLGAAKFAAKTYIKSQTGV